MAKNRPAAKADTTHYFSEQPDTPSRPREFDISVRGVQLTLVSDRGIFSHGRLDLGSRYLAQKMDLPESGDILDLGCGYGVLGLIAAQLAPGARVTLVDINERATHLAGQNAAANALNNVEVLTGDAPEVLGDRQFDVVLCNPPIRAGKDEVFRLIADAASRLRPGGTLWLVIRTRQGAKSRIREIALLFAKAETVSRKRGYRIFRCQK